MEAGGRERERERREDPVIVVLISWCYEQDFK